MALGLLSAACGPEFDPYEQITELRVLAVSADKPSVAPGEATELSVVTFEPNNAEVTYKWSWCPFSAGSLAAYECVISEEELNGILSMFGASVPPYDLGTGETASLPYPEPPQVIPALCELLLSQELPDFFAPPDCSRGINVLVRVDVTSGGQTLSAVREIELLADATVLPNTNPTLGSRVLAVPLGESEEAGILLDPNTPAVLERETEYTIVVEIPEESSEIFLRKEAGSEPVEENELLSVSWFVEAGELENQRTGFVPGEVPIDEARRNIWETPTVKDYEPNDLQIYVVLRDERGGIDFLTRTVAFQ